MRRIKQDGDERGMQIFGYAKDLPWSQVQTGDAGIEKGFIKKPLSR